MTRRERESRQIKAQGEALAAKYAGLDEAVEKRDLRAILAYHAEKHGITFADFVQVLSEGEAEPTPAEVAAAEARRVLDEQRKKDADEAAERSKGDVAAKRAAMDRRLEQMAEKGTAEDPSRWELVALEGAAGSAWDVIEGRYLDTCTRAEDGSLNDDGERLTLEQALDLVEAKLLEHEKTKLSKSKKLGGGASPRTDTKQQGKEDGQAVEPTLSNRSESAAPSKSTVDDDEELDETARFNRAFKKVGLDKRVGA